MSHHHHSHHESESTLSFEEKVAKLLAHWLKHNGDHAATYREWAERSREAGMAHIARIMEAAADTTDGISREFEQALAAMQKES